MARVRETRLNLEDPIETRRRERDIEGILRLIVNSIEGGKFTREQLVRRLEVLKTFPDGIWGRGGPAPPESPEVVKYGFRAPERHKLMLSTAVANVMKARGLTIGKIAHALYNGAASSNYDIRKVSGLENQYVMPAG